MSQSLETQQGHRLLSLWISVAFIPIQVSPPSQLKADVGSLATLGLVLCECLRPEQSF